MNKKVVICASAKFYNEAQEWKKTLESQGFDVIRTVQQIDDYQIEQYKETHIDHYLKLTDCDIVFVLNAEKNGIKGYIGASVFAEIAFAIGLNIVLNKSIQIWLLNPLPNEGMHLDELTKWEKLGWIKQFQSVVTPELIR